MNPATDVMLFEEASDVWQRLSSEVERFVAAWEAGGEPPSPGVHLATVPEAMQRLTAIELVKIDLEYRWLKRKQPRYIEEYLTALPILAADPPVDLLYEEFHVRQQSGETAGPNDLLRRFPKQADELRRLLGAGKQLKTTTLVHREQTRIVRLQPGEQVDDFNLLAALGEGAFGAVYLALQRSMQRLVALKVTADRGSEPQTLAQLDHENIIRVYDQRQLPERGMRLMYMQFAAGGTLQAVVERLRNLRPADRTGRDYVEAVDAVLKARGEEPPADSSLRARLQNMSWPEVVCWIGARLARALDYAHVSGILHRDVKPANVLLTAEGSPKLADFNISFSSKLDGATPTAYFGGSLAYMSPEQLEACSPAHDRTPDTLDGRSDLYSLGIMLWELLCGIRPYEDEKVERSWSMTIEQMLVRRKRGVAARTIEAATRGRAPGLDRILTRCLDPDPERRYDAGDDMARELELCLHPSACRLLRPEPGGWRSLVQKFPATTIILLTVIPNVFGGVLNFLYNYAEIVQKTPGAEPVFWNVQAIINLTLFPMGAIFGIWRVRNLSKYVCDANAREALDDDALSELRRRIYLSGNEAALIGITLWVLAGFIYPLAMHAGLGSAAMSLYVHFFASLVLCGVIAAAYPFLVITFVVVRAILPLFVRLSTMDRRDRERLEKLRTLTWTYVFMAALVPMLAVLMLALTQTQAQWALVFAIGIGIAGIFAAKNVVQRLQLDIDALQVTTSTQLDQVATSVVARHARLRGSRGGESRGGESRGGDSRGGDSRGA